MGGFHTALTWGKSLTLKVGDPVLYSGTSNSEMIERQKQRSSISPQLLQDLPIFSVTSRHINTSGN